MYIASSILPSKLTFRSSRAPNYVLLLEPIHSVVVKFSVCSGRRCGVEWLRRPRVCCTAGRDQIAIQLARSAEPCYGARPVHCMVPLWWPRTSPGSAGCTGQHNTVPVRWPSRTTAHHTFTLPQDWPHIPLSLRRETSPCSSGDLGTKVNSMQLLGMILLVPILV